jgi:2-polyprenyl-3-methyl-5-hydroxy-6-metoxy-1,4-benzoquinol methylase
MEGYYSDPRYIEGGYFADGAGDRAGDGPEVEIFRQALDFLATRRVARGLPRTGRLLDVGAGAGGFLELARRHGWQADGVELSPQLAARAAARSGARVVHGDFAGDLAADELRGGAYDAVTMWDVLEHTVDPGAVLDRARTLLAPDGVLIVLTIDAASLFNTVADIAWRLTRHRLASPLELLYDKRHNHYFTARTLVALLGRHGLRVEHAETHRAHLGRWLSEPASRAVLVGAEIVDLLSVPLGRPYRQLLYSVAS